MSNLAKAIGAMIQTGAIKFQAFSWCFGIVDFYVTSGVFTDKEFQTSVLEDDWNGGPKHAVAIELADLVEKGLIEFAPIDEWHGVIRSE